MRRILQRATTPVDDVRSEAVLTKLLHLFGNTPYEVEAAWKLLRSGAVVLPIGDHELDAIRTLISRYADRPMHFADATLVYLAHGEGLSAVFTVDHDDFETYRSEGRRRFRILPSRLRTR